MESMTSEVFLQRLEELNKQITSRFDATDRSRHQANNAQHTILLNLTNRMDKQDQQLASQTESLTELTTSLRRIETRLVGDSGLGSTGLSQDVSESKEKIEVLFGRVEICETAIKSGDKERSQDRRMVLYTIGIIGTLGAVVTWLRATGALKWLTG